jgi:hypothetical protein
LSHNALHINGYNKVTPSTQLLKWRIQMTQQPKSNKISDNDKSSTEQGQEPKNKMLLGRLDPNLSREEAIEQASEQMFIHLTGRKPPPRKQEG